MIAFTSDLHLGITTENALAELAEELKAARPAALILAGDIAEGPWAFERALEILRDVAPVRGWVAGNHDVWARQGTSSQGLLERRLPEIARDLGYEALEDRTWRFGDLAVIASTAWYDYSAIDPRFARESPLSIERRKREFVNDAERIDWPWSDRDLAARLGSGVERRLQAAERDPAIARIVVATHVPIVEEQMTRKPDDDRWGYSNAYFGNLTLGALVQRFSKVTDVVSGHTHEERDVVVERPGMRSIRARVNGGGYGAPSGWRWNTAEAPAAFPDLSRPTSLAGFPTCLASAFLRPGGCSRTGSSSCSRGRTSSCSAAGRARRRGCGVTAGPGTAPGRASSSSSRSTALRGAATRRGGCSASVGGSARNGHHSWNRTTRESWPSFARGSSPGGSGATGPRGRSSTPSRRVCCLW